ncbi:MAG TPA: protein kinase [Parachlamydiaceae bacterium]|nr:protein kinase [Parachlamydiaceae bacterium]
MLPLSYFEKRNPAVLSDQIYNDSAKSSEKSVFDQIANIQVLKEFNVDQGAFEKIKDYLSNANFKEKTFIHKKQSQLSFSLAYNPIEEKVFLKTRGLAPIGFGSSCNLVAGLDLNTHSKVVYRSLPTHKVPEAERDINIRLSERPDLFVATKEIYDYEGSFEYDNEGIFSCKRQKEFSTERKIPTHPLHKKLGPKTCFILERLDSDLMDLLNFEILNFQDKIDIACDIAKALDVLHNEYGVVHRDLKLENILISLCSVNKNYQAKIADFGQSEYYDKVPKTGGGTFEYISPEWFLYEIENEKNGTPDFLPIADYSSDMWSFGVILFTLFGGVKAFDSWENMLVSNGMIPDHFSSFKKDFLATIEENGNERLDKILELIDFCLEVNPLIRITAWQAHKILQNLQNPQNPSSACEIL